MKPFAFTIVILLVFVCQTFAQEAGGKADEFAAAKNIYDEQTGKIEEKYMGLQANAVTDYEKQLNALEQALAQKADLQGVVAVRKEKERFKTAHSIAIPDEAVVKTPAELNSLQVKIKAVAVKNDADKKNETAKLATAYLNRLEAVKTALTKALKIDDALTVQEGIDRIKGNADLNINSVPTATQESKTTPGNFPANLKNGLVLWYSFDKDEGDKVTDRSGKGNNGKVVGAKWEKADKGGGCMKFDGVKDYIETSFAPTGLTQVSYCAGFFAIDPEPYSGLISSTIGQEKLAGISILGLWVCNNTSPWCPGVATNWSAKLNEEWHYLVGTYDSKQGGKLYLDGMQVRHGFPGGGIVHCSAPALIGYDNAKADRHFRGLISEVRIYNRALSDKEVRQLYEATKKSNEK